MPRRVWDRFGPNELALFPASDPAAIRAEARNHAERRRRSEATSRPGACVVRPTPYSGDAVQVATRAQVLELTTVNGVPGAVVEFDPARSLGLVGGRLVPAAQEPARVWFPLHELVLLDWEVV